MRHAASHDADPPVTLHAVVSPRPEAEKDPRTLLHSDTFHATAKGWLFLRDVAEADGPFACVRGSHHATQGRLDWERARSPTASLAPNPHHAPGSFRAAVAEVREMGYRDPQPLAVPANRLVVADTHGFHGSDRAAGPARPASGHHPRRDGMGDGTPRQPASRRACAPRRPVPALRPGAHSPVRKRETCTIATTASGRARPSTATVIISGPRSE